MPFLLATMMLAFTAAGLFFASMSLRELLRKRAAHYRFERVDGVVLHVQRKVMRSMNRHRFKPRILNLPVIRFTTRAGEIVTFTSEVGDAGNRSRYTPGQRVTIVYDPRQEFLPTLDSWWAIWMPAILALLAGMAFLAGAALLALTYGERMLGR